MQTRCGGAAKRKKTNKFRGRNHRRQKLYQVVKPGSAGGVVKGRKGPKAGSRVRREGAFGGGGETLVEDVEAEDASTYRKRAQSKSAKELRAEAAEKRMKAEAKAKAKEASALLVKSEPIDLDSETPDEEEADQVCSA